MKYYPTVMNTYGYYVHTYILVRHGLQVTRVLIESTLVPIYAQLNKPTMNGMTHITYKNIILIQ